MQGVKHFLSALLLGLLSWQASAQDDGVLGRVTAVDGAGTLTRGASAFALAPPSDLRLGDVIRSTSGSMLELALVDGTRLRLVGASTLVLESFEWNPATGAGRAALRLVSGAMEVQLGAIADSAPNLFMVNTPYGFVTGSQSAFIVIVEPAVNGAGMLVHDLGAGGVVIVGSGGDTRELRERQTVQVSQPNGPVIVLIDPPPSVLRVEASLGIDPQGDPTVDGEVRIEQPSPSPRVTPTPLPSPSPTTSPTPGPSASPTPTPPPPSLTPPPTLAPSATPTPTASATPSPTPTATVTPTPTPSLPPPTPTPTPTSVPSPS